MGTTDGAVDVLVVEDVWGRAFDRLGGAGGGLGLLRVGAIARLHRAHFALEDNEPGLRALVELPLFEGSGP